MLASFFKQSTVFYLRPIIWVCTWLIVVMLLSSCRSTNTSFNQKGVEHGLLGQLEWPAKGNIIEPFGTLINPVYGTRTNNPGILISVSPYSAVQSVYDGEVVEVYTMPEFGRVVMVDHGDFTSLYGNLSSYEVSKGMSVRAGQFIGTAGTDKEPKGESVFFAIFKDGVESDPVLWLRRE